VVVNGDSQLLLRGILSDYVLIQVLFELKRAGQFARSTVTLLVSVILDDGITNRYTFVTDIGAGVITRGGNEFTDYVLAFVAERTAEGIIGSGALQAGSPVLRLEKIKRSLALDLNRYTNPVYQGISQL